MPAKLKPEDRLKLIKRVLDNKEDVTKVCLDANISRTIFYRWLKKYRQSNYQQYSLKPLHRFRDKNKELTPQQRLTMIQRVASGEEVTKVCRDYKISRVVFYRWLKRYNDAPEGQKMEVLWDKQPNISHYRNQAPENTEKAVLSVVVQYPELSTHKIVEFLPQVGNRPILNNHGVQNVLRRHNLSTYEERLAFAAAERRTERGSRYLFYGLRKLLSYLLLLSPRQRAIRVRFLSGFLLGFFTTIVIFGFDGLIEAMSQTTIEGRIGLVLALVAIISGSIFFAYSLKYYFVLALVLGFSRHTDENKDKGTNLLVENKNNNRTINILNNNTINNMINGSWLMRVLNCGSSEAGAGGYTGGLDPNLDKIKLERHPFVSIHLAVYNEKKVVNRLLTACTSFDYENYEVIVVDDSTDETTKILADWQNHPRVKIIHRSSRDGFKGGALREALKATHLQAEFVLVFDADFVPYPDTITQFLKYFKATTGTLDFKTNTQAQESKIAAIQGYQWHVLNKSENWITRGVRSEYAGSYVVERSGTEVYGGMKQIAGSVYMIRKDILEKFGWKTSITEDFQLTLRLYEAGYKVVYTPYIQGPAECVSTIKRLIRQRMRWAEGHSFNVKKLALRLLFGHRKENGQWACSPLTLTEKTGFIFAAPYYLQSALFILGTSAWLLSETVFRARLPFWTTLWGWSLVLTNLLALPLVNTVGLFLEESEDKDYLGIFSFVGLSYLLAPFQAYAAIKGFIEKEEGPWFRTPKTGMVTDIFNRGKFYRWLSGILPGRQVSPALAEELEAEPINPAVNPYLAMSTSNNRFNNFVIKNRRLGWLGKSVLSILLIFSITIVYFSYGLPQVEATNFTNFYLHPEAAAGTPAAPAAAYSMDNVAPAGGTAGVQMRAQRNAMNSGTVNYVFYSDIFPTGTSNAIMAAGNWQVNIIKAGGSPAKNIINFGIQLFVSNANGAAQNQILGNTARINIGLNANNTALSFNLNPTALAENYEISTDNKQRIGFRIFWKNASTDGTDWTNLVVNNASAPFLVEAPDFNVPEIPILALAIPIYVMIPLVPGLVKRARQRGRKKNIWQELAGDWQKFFLGLTGYGENYAETDV